LKAVEFGRIAVDVLHRIAAPARGAALMLSGLVAGSVFGIWRGYDVTAYTPATFVEVHQHAVDGLNTLLPALGLASIVLVAVLSAEARRRRALWPYLGALAFLIAAGLVTRLFNQPINAQVMEWSANALPADWEAIRTSWWMWHLVRVGLSMGGALLVIVGVLTDRTSASLA
jgi:hypothetical protein